MPITPLLTVDDDGSGTTGSVYNAARQLAFEANIDAALAAEAAARTAAILWTEVSTTVTGTQNDFAITSGRHTILRVNNASLVTFTGFTAGIAGQHLLIVHPGAGVASFSHQAAGSVAANRLINKATSAPTSLAASVGIAHYVYDAATAGWRLVDHDQGGWITQAYVAGDFTANNAMTWTVESGDLASLKYYLRGTFLTVSFGINTTTVGGTPSTELHVKYPGGFTVSIATRNVFLLAVNNGGASEFATILHNVGDPGITKFGMRRPLDVNWSAATNTTSLVGLFTVVVD